MEMYGQLVAAIAQGTKSVKYSDKEVVYQTTANMLLIKSQMEAELGINEEPNNTQRRGRRIGCFYKD